MNAHEVLWFERHGRRYFSPVRDPYLRPDPFLRHDAHLFLPPQLRASVSHVGRSLERTNPPEEDEQRHETASTLREIYQLKSAIAKIRYDLAFERFKRAFLRGAYAEQPRGKANFNPAQPRVAAGNPDGGQWTSGAGTAGPTADPAARSASPTRSDLNEDPKLGAQYASRASRGGDRPPIGQFFGTPRQEAELQATQVRAGRAIDAIARVDPYWRPEPSLTSPRNIEQAIGFQRSMALEAEARLDVLFRLNITPESLRPNEIGRPMVEGILSSGGVTIGYQNPGAAEGIRTVSPAEFSQVRDQLLIGAKPMPTRREYSGLMFERSDGTSFGLRLSEDHGPTIDIIRSNHPHFQPGFKVHQR